MRAKESMVTVGIPTLEREAVLLDTIEMVLGQDYKDFEVIVADQTVEHQPEFLNQVKSMVERDKRLRYFLIQPQNLPAARNFIIAETKGQLVLFLDDDVKLKPDFISRHVALHRQHPEARVVVGRINQKSLPPSSRPLYFDKYGLPQGTFNSPANEPATTINGANLSLPTNVIKSIGGFHTAYAHSAIREESDTGYRLVKAGYKIFYSGDTELIHLAASSGGTRIYTAQFDNLRFYINDLLFMLRTVRPIYLPVSIFKRLRIYSGGSGLISLRRFKRIGLFWLGLVAALWTYIFRERNFSVKLVRQIT